MIKNKYLLGSILLVGSLYGISEFQEITLSNFVGSRFQSQLYISSLLKKLEEFNKALWAATPCCESTCIIAGRRNGHIQDKLKTLSVPLKEIEDHIIDHYKISERKDKADAGSLTHAQQLKNVPCKAAVGGFITGGALIGGICLFNWWYKKS